MKHTFHSITFHSPSSPMSFYPFTLNLIAWLYQVYITHAVTTINIVIKIFCIFVRFGWHEVKLCLYQN